MTVPISAFSIVVSLLCPAAAIAVVERVVVSDQDTTETEVLSYVHEVDAGVTEVWEAFTTNEGLASWMAPIVEIDLKIGGKITSNYNEDGELGDETTIENTILSYEPERMLSLQATGFPEGFPFREAAADTWSIFYFESISPTRTRIRVVGLGYRDDEMSRQMKSFFEVANKQSLEQLSEALKNKEGERN